MKTLLLFVFLGSVSALAGTESVATLETTVTKDMREVVLEASGKTALERVRFGIECSKSEPRVTGLALRGDGGDWAEWKKLGDGAWGGESVRATAVRIAFRFGGLAPRTQVCAFSVYEDGEASDPVTPGKVFLVDINNNTEKALRECLATRLAEEYTKRGWKLAEAAVSYPSVSSSDPMTAYLGVRVREAFQGPERRFKIALRAAPNHHFNGYSISVSGGVGGISVGGTFAGYTTPAMDAVAYYLRGDGSDSQVFRFNVNACWYQGGGE